MFMAESAVLERVTIPINSGQKELQGKLAETCRWLPFIPPNSSRLLFKVQEASVSIKLGIITEIKKLKIAQAFKKPNLVQSLVV